MFELLETLFDVHGFPARWYCGAWSTELGWLHIVSDLSTWAAYTAIPLVLGYFVRRRGDLPFTAIFWLFCAFIFSCGTVHLIEALIFWKPVYRLSGVVKLITAVVSWATVLALLPTIPRALALPGLIKVNAQLQHEIEERKRVESALRLEKERYQMLISAMTSLVWTADKSGTPTEGHDLWRSYTGQSLAAQKEHGWIAAVHEEDRTRVLELWESAVRQGSRFETRYRLWSQRLGRHCHVEVKGVPLRSADGSIIEWVGTVTDIDVQVQAVEAMAAYSRRLERLNHELQRSNKELDDFAYIASHDLKEPLRGMYNYATFMRRDYGPLLPQDGLQKLDTIMRLAKRMTGQLDMLMHYSRVGRVDLAVLDVDLNRLVASVTDSLQAMITEHGAEIRIPRPLPTLRCDQARIGELFYNLVSNALKYNDKSSRWVEIGYQDEGSGPVFYVRDNGIGIEEKQFDMIFRIFRRLHGRDEYGGGTGAGLTIVKKIVERHSGRIWLESKPGEGTTFYFTLPGVPVEAREEAGEKSH